MEHLLPYAKNKNIAPHMSQEIFEYHCGMHQLAYVIKLNKGSKYERASLGTIIRQAPAGEISSVAAWECAGLRVPARRNQLIINNILTQHCHIKFN